MQALIFDGQVNLREVPQPSIRAGEALLKIRLAGICNTDLEIIRGYKGFKGIIGHEFVAEIVDGVEDKIGRRVVGEINVACGLCDFCQRGIRSHCRNRSVVGLINHDGAFAEFLSLKIDNLHVVPDTVSDEQAVFVEPLAAACEILEQVHIRPQDHVVLIGAGKLGLLCAQVIKLTGANLSVIGRHDRQMALLQKWGIRAVRRDELEDNQAQVVVDCTGVAAGFADALDIVAPRGTIVLKSTYASTPKVDMSRIVVDEISVVGSRCGSFPTALQYLQQGLVDVESLIDAQYALTDAIRALDHADRKSVLKVLLRL